MRSCGSCRHYEPTRWPNWGLCRVEMPGWALREWMLQNAVCAQDGHPNNYAGKCPCYDELHETHEVSPEAAISS